MSDMLPIWIVLGFFSFLPLLGLAAFIRPIWFPLGFALISPAIWIWGLGLGGYLTAAIGGTLGVLVGAWIGSRRRARSAVAENDPSPGGTT